MDIYLQRATGFYAMASPLSVYLDGQKTTTINHNQRIKLVASKGASLQVGFYWLKSRPFVVEESQDLVIKMNLKVVQLYVLFVMLFFVLALASNQFIIILILLTTYLLILPFLMKKVYVIEEA